MQTYRVVRSVGRSDCPSVHDTKLLSASGDRISRSRMLHITLILDFPGLGVFLGRNGDAFGDQVWRLPEREQAQVLN